MGHSSSKPADPEKDRKALIAYLNNKANLDKLWQRFDRDGNGVIDEDELKELLYRALCLFCKERAPNLEEPTKEQCDSFIKRMMLDLKPYLDENGDGVISRSEFEKFGTYLNREYDKLKKDIRR